MLSAAMSAFMSASRGLMLHLLSPGTRRCGGGGKYARAAAGAPRLDAASQAPSPP